MGRDWYEACARRFGGYRKLWDSRVEGENGEVAFTEWLRQTIPSHPRVLDVGCGDGLYTLHMSALAEHITGIDFSPEMIALAHRNQQSAAIENVTFHVGTTSTDHLPFADQQFDLIYSRRGPGSHLRDARRILKPGGLVAGIHTGARQEILERLTTHGFEVLINQEYRGREVFPSLTDYALFLSRMPGAPDYTLPENEAALLEHVSGDGYAADRWWFIWVAR